MHRLGRAGRRMPALALLLLLSVASAAASSAVMPSGEDALGAFGEDAVDVIAHALSQRRLQQTDEVRAPAWNGRFDPIYKRTYMGPAIAENTCKAGGRNCSGIAGMTYPYEEYILDPTAATLPVNPVIKVHYPKGAWSAGSPYPGGTLFYVYPFKWHPSKDLGNQLSRVEATLEYEVYFPENFPWTKGGKLPGLSGGGDRNGRGCGGGHNPDKCFSSRIMWRRNGMAESYLYVPEGKQADDFCTVFPPCRGDANPPCNVCNYAAGVSMGRGAIMFKTGEWNKITMTVRLNTPNVTNGGLEVKHNDKTVIRYEKMNWRQFDNIFIEGVEVSTWFGGSDTSWGPAYDTHIMLRNFRAWRTDPPALPGARAAEAAPLEWQSRQVLEAEEMLDIAA